MRESVPSWSERRKPLLWEQCVYSVEVSLLDLTKIIRLADPLPKNPRIKQMCKASGFLSQSQGIWRFFV